MRGFKFEIIPYLLLECILLGALEIKGRRSILFYLPETFWAAEKAVSRWFTNKEKTINLCIISDKRCCSISQDMFRKAVFLEIGSVSGGMIFGPNGYCLGGGYHGHVRKNSYEMIFIVFIILISKREKKSSSKKRHNEIKISLYLSTFA